MSPYCHSAAREIAPRVLRRGIFGIVAAMAGAAAAFAQPPRDDRALYVNYGCYQCHGYEGQGGEASRIAPTAYPLETFVARDLVQYIDSHYRTMADRNSRGLVGHSMGGYGATRIGMKHADVFGSLYIMSPCCLSARGGGPANPANEEALAAVTTPADSAKLSFGLRAQLASAAAWSPNPNNPPLYLDLPFGVNQQAVLARWAANAPLAFIDQYVANLRQYRGIAIDVGDQDGLRTDTIKLHDALASYSIAHEFEVYSGTHTSNVAVRFQDYVMPFFSRTLAFDQKSQPQGRDRR